MTDDTDASDVGREQATPTTAEDPTKAVLSESALNKKSLCDYVINVATGCRHGCRFCYVPSTPNIRTRPGMLEDEAGVEDPQREWGSYVLYRDGLGDRLDGQLNRKRTWKETEKGRGVVGISFATDCYMDDRAAGITRDVVATLTDHEKHARVLTRNPVLAMQDLDVFQKAGEYVTVGSSIPSLDEGEVAALEPNAPGPSHRLRGLREIADAGVQVYVSMSPTYPTQDRDNLRALMAEIATVDPAVVFHEPINPRGANFEMTVRAARDAGEDELATALEALRGRDRWVEYAVSQLRWVQDLGEELGIPVHLWPDGQLIEAVSGPESEWLQEWSKRRSPEPFAGRDPPDGPMPKLPGGEST